MSSPFAITAATNSVLLDNNRQGQTSFTVSNTTAHAIRGRAHIVAQQATAGSWLTLLGETERDFANAESQQYVVQIVVPPGAPAGDYTFRLDMINVANPDDDFSEGPTVKFVVAQPAQTKRPFPWWIVAVIVGILILVGGGSYGIIRVSHNNLVITPTATVSKPSPTFAPPSPSPSPVLTGPWQGNITFNNGQNTISATLHSGILKSGALLGTLDTLDAIRGPSSATVAGSAGSLNLFNSQAQSRLQQAINLYGNGSGTYMEFEVISYSSSNSPFPLNSAFDGVVFPDGSLHGIWFNPGDIQGGTFIMNETSQGSIPTEHPFVVGIGIYPYSN